MQRNISMLEEDKSQLITRLQAYEKQIEILKLQIEEEKLKLGGTENLLAKERALQRQADIRMRELENERNDLREEVEQLKTQISGISIN